MSIRDLKGEVKDKIPVNNVIISVFDKSGLEDFIPGLIETNSDIKFLSTGGTYNKLKKILGGNYIIHLLEISSEYTECPEMEGGLVKTLHPKIHAGILGERNNPAHQKYLNETLSGVFIDMVVVNLYPFEKVISDKDVTFEEARGNIDIGGLAMLRAAAKNFPGCAAVCEPFGYTKILSKIKENNGCTTFSQRLNLAKKVFGMTAEYDRAIEDYITAQIHHNLNGITSCYKFSGGS